MSRDPKSPLLKKRALDALLDTMADGLDGHDNYDELGAHRRGESTPEQKGTEFDNLEGTGFMPSAVIIPPKDLAPPSSPDEAEFFKESEPKFSAGSADDDRKVAAVLAAPSPEHKIGEPFEEVVVEAQQGLDEKYAAVEPIEEEIEEHEFFKQAPNEDIYRTMASCPDCRAMLKHAALFRLIEHLKQNHGVGQEAQALAQDALKRISEWKQRQQPVMASGKTAGHRVKDTGEYDEKNEERIRQIMRETAQYADDGANFDPSGEYLCGGCHYMLGNTQCAFVEGDDISKKHGSCRFWKVADGKAPVELERKFNKQEAGYGERKDQPFGCQRCEYGFEAKAVDSADRKYWCERFGAHVRKLGCCAENSLPGDTTYNSDNSVSKQGNFVSLDSLTKTAAKTLYHVTNTATVPAIKAKGILPLQTSNWVKGPEGERYGEGEIFAMDNPVDAVRWAAKMDWEFNKGMGTGKISIIAFTPGKEKWKTDSSDPISQGQNKGKWLKAVGSIKPEQIISSHVLEPEMVKAVVQGKDVKLARGDYGDVISRRIEEAEAEKEACMKEFGMTAGEKTADVPTKSYGMGTPIGGTDNPDAGADDEVELDEGEANIQMTGALDEEDECVYAMLDEEDERFEKAHEAAAKRLDRAAFTVASFKVASMNDVGWFAKSARPSPQKLELLQKQLKLSPEQIELCINTDPSPNQSDFTAWIAKFLAKGAFQLPEDTDRIKGQLDKFQKFKKSPNFTFSKDIQQYDPAKLFETLETAESTGLGSKKEQQREVVNKGAQVVVNEGDVKIYKVTEPRAAMELGGGTNWCTAPPGNTMAATYLKDGPLYIFFDGGSAVAQLHCPSNQFMNRADVCILESVTGESSGYGMRDNVKRFLADPGLRKALQLLAAKEPEVKEWVEEKIADPEDVKKILGEAAAEEIGRNVEYEKELEQYNKDMVEYERQMKVFEPKNQKFHDQYEVYQAKMNEWFEKGEVGPRPEPPKRPEEPRKPWHPGAGDSYSRGYGYGRRSEPRGKQFTMQVRNALASGQPLLPEVEQQLVGAGVNVDLLLKYGSLFHPGQPWEPLAATILEKVQRESKVTKEAIDYAAKFIKGPWPELEPLLLPKLFLVTRNMENMRTALDYAIRARKTRWPEFEDKIAKAKPGAASGYGAAEYAIRVLKMPWSQVPGIKRKKNGKINAEECMIVGNPGEARKYSEAFMAGKTWDEFATSALNANNLAALINYAADTLKTRMPELEEKILSGQRDAQESKGRQRHRQFTDLALDYAVKVIKGRWPEYEAKVLEHITNTEKSGGYGSNEYKPSHGEHSYSYHGNETRLGKRISNYITQVVKGRWAELEQVLLARYPAKPALWATNQNLVDGYLTTLGKACQERYKDNSPVPEPAGNEVEDAQGASYYGRPTRKDERKQKPFTKFQQDAQCYWPEGEQRLITRDEGYEAVIVEELKQKALKAQEKPDDDDKYVSPEDLAKMEKPGGEISYEQKKTKPDHTIWNGIWIGWYSMDEVEKYTDYMLSNGQTWPLGVDIMELHEDLEDVRGRWNHSPRPQRRQQEAGPKPSGLYTEDPNQPGVYRQSSAERFQQRFSSSLLRKKALIEMHESPSMLPPRDDISSHMDKQMQDQLTKEVMQGVREPLNPKKKKRLPQINPLLNPTGVQAAEEDEDFSMMGKVGPFYRIDSMRYDDVAAFHGKRFADNVKDGKKVTVYRAGKPGEKLVPGTFLSANKNMALSYQHEGTESFGGPELYRYEVDPKDLIHVENFEASELVYKPRQPKNPFSDIDPEVMGPQRQALPRAKRPGGKRQLISPNDRARKGSEEDEEFVDSDEDVKTYTPEQVLAYARNYFGTTSDPKAAGFIMPNGGMITWDGTHHDMSATAMRMDERDADGDPVEWPRWVEVMGIEGDELMQFVNYTGAIRIAWSPDYVRNGNFTGMYLNPSKDKGVTSMQRQRIRQIVGQFRKQGEPINVLIEPFSGASYSRHAEGQAVQINQVDALIDQALGKKKADYTQEDWEQDESTQLWLDQVSESEDEAKRHFMQEDYIKQLAEENSKTMDEMWDMLGEEYTNEFYGYPYKTVSDFTDEETKGIGEEEKPVGVNGKVSASVAGDGTSRVYVNFMGKDLDFADAIEALNAAKAMSKRRPGEPALFIIDEEGVVTEDTFIDGQHVGETVEKFAFRSAK